MARHYVRVLEAMVGDVEQRVGSVKSWWGRSGDGYWRRERDAARGAGRDITGVI